MSLIKKASSEYLANQNKKVSNSMKLMNFDLNYPQELTSSDLIDGIMDLVHDYLRISSGEINVQDDLSVSFTFTKPIVLSNKVIAIMMKTLSKKSFPQIQLAGGQLILLFPQR